LISCICFVMVSTVYNYLFAWATFFYKFSQLTSVNNFIKKFDIFFINTYLIFQNTCLIFLSVEYDSKFKNVFQGCRKMFFKAAFYKAHDAFNSFSNIKQGNVINTLYVICAKLEIKELLSIMLMCRLRFAFNQHLLNRVQCIQNSCFRFSYCARKYDYISPYYQRSDWLKIW